MSCGLIEMPESDGRPKVLFISQKRTSFINDDLVLLSERYDVRPFEFGNGTSSEPARKPGELAQWFARQLAWLRRELPDAAFVYGWFADYHLTLPVWLGRRMQKPVAVALGGFDANVVPDLDYGVYGSSWRAPLARYVVRNASLLLPVSESLIYHENTFAAPPEVLKNGVAYHVSGLKTPHVTIPTGYDAEAWPMGPPVRPPVVSTVAYLGQERAVRVKGVDLLIDAAWRLPEATFQVVGVAPEFEPKLRARYRVPENVHLLPPRRRDELVEVYAGTSVYAQLSRTEGLPNVLAEAMCCGCIPVGSAVSGIPDLIGETGVVVDQPDPDAITEAIRLALTGEPDDRVRARDRIISHFSLENRRRKLFEALDRLVAGEGTQT